MLSKVPVTCKIDSRSKPKSFLETALLVLARENKIAVLVLHNQLTAGLVGRHVEWNPSGGPTQSQGGRGRRTPWHPLATCLRCKKHELPLKVKVKSPVVQWR